MKKIFILQLISAIIVLALIMSPVTFADADTNLTVNITINSVGAIVVLPNAFTWSLDPGADSSTANVIIQNTGSANLTNIYLDTSTDADESTNPLPTGVASAYSAAGLIFVKNSTNDTYYHAGRIEWNISSILAGEVLDLASATETFAHGWYRNASGNEFLWKVENGTDGYCNTTATVFKIKTAPENTTDLNRDLSTGLSTCGAVTQGTWGSFACTDGPLANHCVATASTCDKIYIYKYNYNSTYAACGNRAYIRSADLIPGAEDFMVIHASIPYGIPAGETALGTLTLMATS
ncbi:MAG: hypothetical protein KAJ20_03870 [Candidatus Aenigmarchaeota archaeon]|nr:hypothetical protein [Candidatus Aenigmarchaeota archaeon]MCK5373451.1 hypothetical protein [Candidatus Aenigmarchaeota archaeon]